MKKEKANYTIEWDDAKLCMDTVGELEGLHIYIIRRGKKIFKNGKRESVSYSVSEYVDRKRAKQIRNEIDRRLFGGAKYEGMPSYLE
jgi:hypothetical protein